MGLRLYILLFIILNYVSIGFSWDVLTKLGSRREGSPTYAFDNEYKFGDCKNLQSLKSVQTVQIKAADIKTNTIFRGYLYWPVCIPKCMIVKATNKANPYRVTKYNIALCVMKISWLYNQRRNIKYMYEFCTPQDIVGDTDWDLHFYAQPDKYDWTDL